MIRRANLEKETEVGSLENSTTITTEGNTEGIAISSQKIEMMNFRIRIEEKMRTITSEGGLVLSKFTITKELTIPLTRITYWMTQITCR